MAFVTLSRQETQIRNSDAYNDGIAPSEANFETNPTNLEEDLNNMRSQLHNLLNVQGGNWWDDLVAPSTLETGTQRGVNDLNTALHLVEKKRILRDVLNLVDITVPAGQNYVVLSTGELPSNTTAAVGAVSTLGTVVATHSGTFGAHSLDEVAGLNAINPKNLMVIVDGATRDPILSGGNEVFGLLQGEGGLVDGDTITDTTDNRVQISFVRVNATGDDLEAVPVTDIENAVINYTSRERVRLEDLNEVDFLKPTKVDQPPSGGAVNRQGVYDNQGTTAVDLTTNATLDLEAAGIQWLIRDDLEASLFGVVEGSAGGTSQVNIYGDVDEFDVDAAVNNFSSGASLNSGGTRPIDVGVNDGVVETTAGDLRLAAAVEMLLDDGNQAGSTWAQTTGIKLSENTAEWDEFETEFGEVSLLDAIVQAKNTSEQTIRRAKVTAPAITAGTNVTGAGGSPNVDNQLQDYSALDFDLETDIFLNGFLLFPADTATEDVYPGDTPANGDLKFTDVLRSGDVITMVTVAGRTA